MAHTQLEPAVVCAVPRDLDALVGAELKRCPKCAQTKPVDQYNLSKRTKSGLMTYCRPCANAASREWQRKNAKQAKDNLQRWRSENPEKYQAQLRRSIAAQALNSEPRNQALRQRRAENPERFREANRRWRAANVVVARAATRAWQAKNRDHIVAWRKQYRQKNLEAVRQRLLDWLAKNPDATRRHNANRRARARRTGGTLSPGLVPRLLKLQRGRCACGCGRLLGRDFHLDHIVPLARGGGNVDKNMQLLRRACNLFKHAKDPIDFMRQQGFLI